MAKKTNSDELYIESLEEKIRELKSVVRSLTKRLKKVSRGYYKYLNECEEQEQEVEVRKFKEEVKDVLVKVCHECGGNYRLIIIGTRRFRKCQTCGKKGKVSYLDSNGNEIK